MKKNTQNILIGVAIGIVLAKSGLIPDIGIGRLATHTKTGNQLPGLTGIGNRGWRTFERPVLPQPMYTNVSLTT